MSDSLTIETRYPVEIEVSDLTDRVRNNLRYLLNQDESFLPDFDVLRIERNSLESVSKLVPDGGFYTLFEHKYLNRGSNFFYKTDQDWRTYSDRPVFIFYISGIKRDLSGMVMAVCMALAISVAELLSSNDIIDGHGVWVRGRDELDVDVIRSLRVDRLLPIEEALHEFYRKFPVRY